MDGDGTIDVLSAGDYKIAWFKYYDDADGDGVSECGGDCDDTDISVFGVPVVVVGLGVDKNGAYADISWISQDPDAGPGTDYDVVTGLIGDLRVDMGYASAICLQNAQADTPYQDTRVNPSPNTGYYYMVRSRNSCGTGTYGPAELDASAPCP